MQTVINDFLKYIQENGGNPSTWYVGIAADPKSRLFNDHNVNQLNGQWVHTTNPCSSSDIARKIEQHLLGYGFQGGSGGGDYSTKHIYAYKITSYTRE